MAEWEGLDVDDSDLVQQSLARSLLARPSPLLPSKRVSNSLLHDTCNNKSTANSSCHWNLPSLEPCSQFPSRSSLSLAPKKTTPLSNKNTISLTQQEKITTTGAQQFSQSCRPEETRVFSKGGSNTRHPIPGPAGAVQAAMSRHEENHTSRRRRSSDSLLQQEEDLTPKPGPEDEGGHYDDEDFKHNSWLCAVDLLLNGNMGNGMGGSSLQFPISSIKTCQKRIDRVPRVIGIIKSCKQNGHGDLIVTLKDPTGTIDATVHHKVLADSKFGRGISVGCAVILQQVAVFSPTRSVHYLNIILDNVVKVIRKDCGPPPKHRSPPFACRRTTADEPREFGPAQVSKTAGMSEEFVSLSQAAKNNDDAIDGSRHGWQDVGVADGRVGTNDEVGAMEEAVICLTKTESGSGGNGPNAEKLVERRPNCEIGTLGAVTRVIPSISVGQWTDEQIDELFACYEEEDMQV